MDTMCLTNMENRPMSHKRLLGRRPTATKMCRSFRARTFASRTVSRCRRNCSALCRKRSTDHPDRIIPRAKLNSQMDISLA